MNKKLLMFLVAGCIFSSVDAFARDCTSTTENGITTETCSTLWSGPEVSTYDAAGNLLSVIIYDKENVPELKAEYTYNSAGDLTSQTFWDTPESVANNAPTSKEERVYEGSTVYYIEYYNNESIINNTPDSKSGYTYDENGNEVARVEWYSPESVANDTPDYKWASQYNAEQGVWFDAYYESPESIQNNVPDYNSFYIEETGGRISYDKDGNLAGIGFDNVIEFDDQGRITRSGSSEPCVYER